MRKLFAAILALWLATLAGCARTPPDWTNSGPLDPFEVALIESQYLKSVHETAKRMGFDSWTRDDDRNALELDAARGIAGKDYTQRLMFSRPADEFWGVTLSNDQKLDGHGGANAVAALEFYLTDAYGQPAGQDFYPEARDIYDWLVKCLDNGPYTGGIGDVTGYAVIHWEVGSMTRLSMCVQVMEGRYCLLSMEYRLDADRDGRALTGDELRERVRKLQEKWEDRG